jgi:hypothetical protein
MPAYLLRPPEGVTEIDAGRVERYLTNQGIVVESVTVLQSPEGLLTYYIECDTDPSSVVHSYVKVKSAQEQARDRLTELKPFLIDGTATVGQMRTALAALVILQDL